MKNSKIQLQTSANPLTWYI